MALIGNYRMLKEKKGNFTPEKYIFNVSRGNLRGRIHYSKIRGKFRKMQEAGSRVFIFKALHI